MKAGRFLAGDLGARFTVSKFINGVIVCAWYGITDTSISRTNTARDTGTAVSGDYPSRLFKGEDSRTSYWYSLTPVDADAAQDIIHYSSLFDFKEEYGSDVPKGRGRDGKVNEPSTQKDVVAYKRIRIRANWRHSQGMPLPRKRESSYFKAMDPAFAGETTIFEFCNYLISRSWNRDRIGGCIFSIQRLLCIH
ncbi:MAG: YjbH domain-containing protein [Desulfomicrobium escambiense]|nr:YjbH domain-containing protein [Desulfomicrobium escambiense]